MSAAPNNRKNGIPEVRALNSTVLRWYRKHGRSLPWRNAGDPYRVVVSEVMLQQTQVSRVLEKYPLWLEAFPSIRALAHAPKRTVLIAWSGMGYNRRALNFHEAAKIIVSRNHGVIPDTVEELSTLPGFGKYTASAIACFGFRKRVPVADINIRRVLGRISARQEFTNSLISEPEAWALAAEYLPPRAFYDWNQALMDLGAMVCTATKPGCSRCPVRGHCASAGQMKEPVRIASGSDREIPRRIFRGRVVEFLRSGNGAAAGSFTAIGSHLDAAFSEERYEWLADILRTLQKDGMIQIHEGRKAVHLDGYSGDLSKIKVFLAE